MSAHTPGPWHDDGYRIYAPTDAADKRRGRMIVEYKHVDDFNDPDASLIAAAPDLLGEAQVLRCLASSPRFQAMTVADALAELAANGCGHDGGAAIAKATGGAA